MDRTKGVGVDYYKGDNWFSITHELALYVVEHNAFIKKHFDYSICADEMFLHTLAKQSPYCKNIIDDCLRLIDWQRGTPYTYTSDDYEELIQSDKLFARKFDENVDITIVEKIYDRIKQN